MFSLEAPRLYIFLLLLSLYFYLQSYLNKLVFGETGVRTLGASTKLVIVYSLTLDLLTELQLLTLDFLRSEKLFGLSPTLLTNLSFDSYLGRSLEINFYLIMFKY